MPDGTKLTILNNISFQIRQGESVAISGPSGSGKSTLLALLAGLDRPTRGEVILDELRLNELDEDGLARARLGRVGFIFQNFQLLPVLTALENVLLPLELADKADARATALYCLDRVGLSERIHHYPNQLSGGEQQRVAIARAYAGHPAILFADEPTGNLDHQSATQVADLLFDLNREQKSTLLLTSHNLPLVQRCQRCLFIEQGQLHESQ